MEGGMNLTYIIDPSNNKLVSVFSEDGKVLLKKYIKYFFKNQ